MKIAILYLLGVNVIAFLLFGIDKKRAIDHSWRIKESTLFLSAIIGGSIGSILGMQMFRHKTKHWYFVFGVPAILILQIAAVIIIRMKGLI